MTLRLTTRSLPLLLLVAVGWQSASALAQPSSGGVPRLANGDAVPSVRSAEFSDGKREGLLNNDAVSFRDGSAILAPGGEVVFPFRLAPSAVLSVDVDVADLTAAEAVSETWLTIAVGTDRKAGVAVVQELVDDEVRVRALLISVAPDAEGKLSLTILRTIPNPGRADGEWTVRYEHGVVEVLRGGRALARADANFLGTPVLGARVEQPRHEATVRRLVLGGRPSEQRAPAELERAQAIFGDYLAANRELSEALGERDFEKGLRAARTSGELSGKIFGPNSITTLKAVDQEGLMLTLDGRHAEAIEVYSDLLERSQRLFGPRHTFVGRVQRDRGIARRKLNRNERAYEDLAKAAEILPEVLPDGDREIVYTLDAFGGLLQHLRRYEEATRTFRRGLAFIETSRTPDPESMRSMRRQLATALEQLSRLDEAARELDLCLETLPDDAESLDDRVRLVHQLAKVRVAQDDFRAARLLLDALQSSLESTTPARPLAVASTVLELAAIDDRLGDAAAARSRLEKALQLARTAPPGEAARRAGILSSMGSLHRTARRMDEALAAYREAARIYRDLGESAASLHRITLEAVAECHLVEGDHEEAIRVGNGVLALVPEELPYQRVSPLSRRGTSREVLGDHDGAVSDYEEALAIEKSLDVPSPITVPILLERLSWIAWERGDRSRAVELEDEALRFLLDTVGEEHALVANHYFSNGVSRQLAGDWAAAVELYERSLELNRRITLRLLGGLSETEAVLQSQRLQETRSGYIGLLRTVRTIREGRAKGIADPPGTPTTLPDVNAGRVYEFVLSTKALASRVLAFGDVSAGDSDQLDELRSVNHRLAALHLSTGPSTPDEGAVSLETLTRRRDQIERGLVRVRADRSVVDLESLAKSLPDDAVLLDFVESSKQSRRVAGMGEDRVDRAYDVFVVRHAPDGEGLAIEWIEIGEAAAVDAAALEWRKLLGGRGLEELEDGGETPRVELSARELHRLVWSRIAPHVDGVHNVYVVPDGPLSRIPWGALEDAETGMPLVEEFAFVSLPHAAGLAAEPDRAVMAVEPLLLVGDVDYGPRDEDTPRRRWSRLPGTGVELDRITDLLGDERQAKVLRGRQPTRTSVLAAIGAARTVHVATHGFAMTGEGEPDSGDQTLTPLQRTRRRLESSGGRNPLVRCGLVLAGANERESLEGLVTGADILTADLRRTSLVVLSACETHVGDEASGEGVYSLVRAFHGAGARFVIASLWRVDDAATTALMAEFYRQLLTEQHSAADALRLAQREMRRRYDPVAGRLAEQPRSRELHPRFWAAFVISEDGE